MSEFEKTELENDEVLQEDNAASIAMNPTDVSRSELMAMMVNYANSLGNKEELAAFVAKLPNAKEMTRSNDEIYNSVTKLSILTIQ
jgi:hypothetical protein